MTIKLAVASIKRHENVNVIINSRSKITEDYKITSHDLKDITINPNYEVEIKLHDKYIFVPVDKIIVNAGATYVVFYMENQQILFNY